MSENKGNTGVDLKQIAMMGMFTALAFAAMMICKLIPPVGGFLSFDLKDTVIAIGGFLYGPVSAALLAVLTALLEFFSGFSDTGPIGLIMNILSSVAFVCPTVYLYRRRHTTHFAVLGLVAGIMSMVILMTFWNLLITPLYLHIERKAVVAMLPTLIIPFNLVKGILNSAVIMLLYPPVSVSLRKAGLVPERKEDEQKRKFSFIPMIAAAAVLAAAVALLIFMIKK